MIVGALDVPAGMNVAMSALQFAAPLSVKVPSGVAPADVVISVSVAARDD